MINVERLRQQVQKAINALPAEINLKRLMEIDDGYGGSTKDEVEVKTFNAFIDFASNKPSITINTSESGSITSVKNIILLAAYDTTFSIQKDDYFSYKGTNYKIRYPINQFDIYWECELEVIE